MFEFLEMFLFFISIPLIMRFSILLVKFMIEHFPDFEDLKGDDEDDPES